MRSRAVMQTPVFLSCLVISLTIILSGCSSRNQYDIADPVVGPPPPRRLDFESLSSVADNSESESNLQLTSYTADQPIPLTEVVARVNGTPILAGQILEPFAPKLMAARKQLSPTEFRKAQEMLLKRNLPAQIEQTLMVDAVKSKLKQEQFEQIDAQLDEFFEFEVERLKGQFQVSNSAELEGVLQSQGMSLVSMREMFGNRQLATEYISGKIGTQAPLTRQDLLAEYNRRKEEFAKPEQVKWQQIQVSHSQHGSRDAATRVLNQAITELQQGVDFSDVAKRYSDGPLKDNGGHWDWTQPESIASIKVREALSQLQSGQTSAVISNQTSFQIVKVTGHKPASYTSFAQVQEKIRTELISAQREEKAKQVIAELKVDAIIETMFDDDNSNSEAILR